MFKQEFEFLTSNTKISFPFVDEISPPTSVGNEPFSNLVADLYLAYTSIGQERIKLVALSDPSTYPVHVKFEIASGGVVFESLAGTTSTYGEWTVCVWTAESSGPVFEGNAYGDTSNNMLLDSGGNALIQGGFIEDQTAYSSTARMLFKTSEISKYTWPVTLTDAYLVPTCLYEIIPTVTGIGAFSVYYRDVPVIEAGYNMSIQPVESTITSARGRSSIRISAEPGAGLGSLQDCEKDLRLLTINGVGPDKNGNIQLNALDCYRWELPTSVEGINYRLNSNSLVFFNNCEPCCQCSDYVYIYDHILREVYEEAKEVSDSFYDARDKYVILAERMIAEKECRERVWAELRVFPRHGWTVGIQVIVNNDQPCEASGVLLNINVDSAAEGELIPESAYMFNDDTYSEPIDIGEFPNFSYSITGVIPGTRKVVVYFEVYFKEEGGREDALPVVVAASGTTSEAFLGNLFVTTAMKTSFNKIVDGV